MRFQEALLSNSFQVSLSIPYLMSNIYADDEYHGSLDLFAEKAMCIVQPHTKLRDLGALSYAGY